MQAVDAIYRADDELAAEGGLSEYPADLIGVPSQPDAFRDFTRYEIEQASLFLVRMGLIVPRNGPSAGFTD